MKRTKKCCIKFFLTLCNIICILIGLTLMVFCTIVVVRVRERKGQSEQQATFSRTVLTFFLTLSLGLVVTAVLGCVGSLKEHVRILYVHACFFIFLLTIELVLGVAGAGISAWVGRSNELRQQFFMNNTIEDNSTSHLNYWDVLQTEYECCGIDGPQDYAVLDRDIPPSCCPRAQLLRDGGPRQRIHAKCLADKTYYVLGCEKALHMKKARKRNAYIFTGIIFVLLEVSCIVLAWWMVRTLQEECQKSEVNLQAHFKS